jgi:hypothetical protein
MSEPLRLALVAEGPTDRAVIDAALSKILDKRPFILIQLQPEGSLAFGPLGTGWGGVYRWCKQAVARDGALSNDPLFLSYDLLILHLDADVAKERYQNANIHENPGDLPCAEQCPPAQATTDRLREVLLRWVGEPATPERTVLCIPSMSSEAWVVAALFPTHPSVRDGSHECRPHRQQPLRIRIAMSQSLCENLRATLGETWETVTEICFEARRFRDDFRVAVQTVDAAAAHAGGRA